MNSYFNNGFNEEKKRSSRLPAWIWIIGVVGLIIAILSGYTSGVQAVDIYNGMMEAIMLKDTNGEDTSLQTLNFSEFIGVYDNVYGYNFFDSDMSFSLSYNTTVKYNNAKGLYPNDFSGSETVNYSVNFKTFNHYDITYAKKTDKALTFIFSSEITEGNLEARILRIDANYRVKETELGTNVIEDAYVHEVARFSANKIESVTLEGGHIYVLAVGCESASGLYSLKTEVATVPVPQI